MVEEFDPKGNCPACFLGKAGKEEFDRYFELRKGYSQEETEKIMKEEKNA